MLLLDSNDVAALLDYPSCIAAVEGAFLQLSRKEGPGPVVCGVSVANGGFHVKAAALAGPRPYFVAKTNANFPENPSRAGLPTIQGVALLFDGGDGRVLSALDSGELTVRRTAAATAVAAKHLARAGSETVLLCGCGVQGRAHVRALAAVLPISTVFAYDTDPGAAEGARDELADLGSVEILPVRALREHALRADICVTCTPARAPILGPDDVRPGTFVAGVGADHPAKSELSPALLAGALVVVDVEEQCAAMGDLHHALASGLMRRESVHAELGDVIAANRPGRRDPRDIIVFDSTGMALQDVAAAGLAYERAVRQGRGFTFDLAPRGTGVRPGARP